MGKSPKVNTHSHLILPLANNFLLFSVRTISRINHAPEAELKCEGPLRSSYPRRGELRKGMSSLCSRCCVQTSPSRSFPSFSPSVLLCHYYYFPWVLLPNKITQSHMIIFPWDSLIWITFLSIFLMSGTYTHILSRNSRHKSTSWILRLSTPYIWETGSHRWSNLVEILELEGSGMSLKLRSVSMLLTTALCCLTLSMLIRVNTVLDQRKDQSN